MSARRPMSARRRSAFSLLEVMVATAILAIALTAIFSSQGGAVKAAHRSRKMALATNLVRCKMGEIEERIARDGLPAVEAHGDDSCCEDAKLEGFSCKWRIERIVLPDSAGGSSLTDAQEAIKGGNTNVDSLLAGGKMPGGDIADMAFSLAFPVLKPEIEEQVRRATVEVHWREGDQDRSFDVVQFLVSETAPGGLVPGSAGPGGPTPGGGSKP